MRIVRVMNRVHIPAAARLANAIRDYATVIVGASAGNQLGSQKTMEAFGLKRVYERRPDALYENCVLVLLLRTPKVNIYQREPTPRMFGPLQRRVSLVPPSRTIQARREAGTCKSRYSLFFFFFFGRANESKKCPRRAGEPGVQCTGRYVRTWRGSAKLAGANVGLGLMTQLAGVVAARTLVQAPPARPPVRHGPIHVICRGLVLGTRRVRQKLTASVRPSKVLTNHGTYSECVCWRIQTGRCW